MSPSENGKAEADKPEEWKEAVGGISSIDYADGTYTFHYSINSNGNDIKITGNGSPSIVMDVDDTAVYGNLTVRDVEDVILTKSRLNMDPVVIGDVDITCTGDVRIKNNCTNYSYTPNQEMKAVSGSLKVTTSGDVKIRGMVNSSTNGDVVIDTTGVVELSSPNGPVSGKGLTVKNASYVGVSSRKGIFYSYSDLALENCALIELKDDYAKVLGKTDKVTISPDSYQLYAGYNESSATEKESLDDCGNANYIRIETGAKPQAKPVASLTILDEFSSYYTTVTYILNRYEDGSVSWKNGQDPWNGAVDVKYDADAKTFVFTGTLSELAESDEDRVTMICSDKEDSIRINGNVSAATLSIGIGTDTIGAKDLTIQSNSSEPAVREVITLNCSGDVSITNPSGAITGNSSYNSGVYCYGASQSFTITGNSTDPLTGDGLRLYAKKSVTVENLSGPVTGSSLSVEDRGSTSVKITGNSSKGLMQSTTASADISAANLTMENKSGPVGNVKFTRTDTTSDYRILTGKNADNIPSQTAMTGSTFEQTVEEAYLCIEPGTPHEHTADTEWKFDETSHWHTCTTCNQKVDESEHTFVNDECTVCHYKRDHVHTPGDWESNETSHWKTCSTCNEKVDEGKHDFGEDGNAKTCAECGYANPNYKEPEHQHTADTEWKSDSTSHWHACATCDENVQLNKAPHDFGEDGNAKTCAICGAANPNYEEPDQPDTPDTPDVPDDSGDSGSAVGAVVAGAAIGGTALFVGYEVVTDTILGNLLPEGADTPVNRGQLAWLIWGTKGAPEPEHQPSFTDVSDPEMAKAAQWCVEQGLMDAKSTTTFAPNGWTPKFRVIETWNRAFPKQ